jgi:hypothetical protein
MRSIPLQERVEAVTDDADIEEVYDARTQSLVRGMAHWRGIDCW